MMTLDEVKAALQDRNLAAISRATGLSYFALSRLRNTSENPGFEFVRTVIEYLEKPITTANNQD